MFRFPKSSRTEVHRYVQFIAEHETSMQEGVPVKGGNEDAVVCAILNSLPSGVIGFRFFDVEKKVRGRLRNSQRIGIGNVPAGPITYYPRTYYLGEEEFTSGGVRAIRTIDGIMRRANPEDVAVRPPLDYELRRMERSLERK